MTSVKRQLITGVAYNAIAKYVGIVISLVVVGVLARIIPSSDFGVMTVATVFISFFSILSDMGIAPAIVQHKELKKDDLENIFSYTVWAAVIMSILFFLFSNIIAHFYNDYTLVIICRILSVNLLFATMNIVPNALLLQAKRFRFIAVRTISVQVICGIVSVFAACGGAGVYALLINPILSSVIIFVINYKQNPQRFILSPKYYSMKKIISFSTYQFLFNIINYFSRNADKLLIGRYMDMSLLGYYEKSYRLMMLPLQNITHVVSPVMHPVFSDMRDDMQKLSDSYIKIVRLFSFIGFPLSVFLFFSARELVLILFGYNWMESIPVFKILSISVGVQILLSTTGSIFQAANSTKTLFISGLLSTILNVTGVLIGIFVFDSLEAVAWSMCITFTINFIQCYILMYMVTFKMTMVKFWKQFISPVILSIIVSIVLCLIDVWLADSGVVISIIIKGISFLFVCMLYIQYTKEYNIKAKILTLLQHKNRS